MTENLDLLLKLRLVVARVGEMDLARWWNTKGQLGALGSSVLRRGFPRTHHFAQARSAFATAAHRCAEVYDPPQSVTLWKLPAPLEDAFEMRWERWLDAASAWRDFFEELADCGSDLAVELERFGLLSDDDVDRVSRLNRSAESRAVKLPGTFRGSDADLTALALAFSRGQTGNLAVPFQTSGETAK